MQGSEYISSVVNRRRLVPAHTYMHAKTYDLSRQTAHMPLVHTFNENWSIMKRK